MDGRRNGRTNGGPDLISLGLGGCCTLVLVLKQGILFSAASKSSPAFQRLYESLPPRPSISLEDAAGPAGGGQRPEAASNNNKSARFLLSECCTKSVRKVSCCLQDYLILLQFATENSPSMKVSQNALAKCEQNPNHFKTTWVKLYPRGLPVSMNSVQNFVSHDNKCEFGNLENYVKKFWNRVGKFSNLCRGTVENVTNST